MTEGTEDTATTTTVLESAAPAAPPPSTAVPDATGQTAAGSSAPPWHAMFNPDGTYVENWWRLAGRHDLDAHAATLARSKTPADMAAAVAEIQKIRPGPPGEGATPDTVATFKRWVGVPDKWEVKAPEGRELAPELLGRFTGIAERHHGVITNKCLQELTDEFIKITDEGEQVMARQAEEKRLAALAELEKQHGRDWEKKLANAQVVARRAGLDPADPEIGNSPTMISALIKLHDAITADALHGANSPTESWSGDGAAADDIMYNKANPLHDALTDPSHPRYREACDRYERLMRSHLRAIGKL